MEFLDMEIHFHVGMQLFQKEWCWNFVLGDRIMRLFLQFGYGMMEHCRSLIGDWEKGSVILSPRDLKPTQLESLSAEITECGGRVMLDPQFYSPNADHDRLVSHDYWPKDYESGSFWSGDEQTALLQKLKELNEKLKCYRFILPGTFASVADEDWLERQLSMIEEAVSLGIDPQKSLATVALSEQVVRNVDQVHEILDASKSWKTQGVYLICEHPPSGYLVDDPVWLANVLDLAAGFRLKRWSVVIGYCNHQMLIAGCTSTTAIASGTWMNVRSFPPDKFKKAYDEEIKKRTKWYYCPQSLSEYKIPFLDIAAQQGVLSKLKTPDSYGSIHADLLFQGPQPSTVQFSEQAAFRHYLHCLRHQVLAARKDTFEETVEYHYSILDTAEKLIRDLKRKGISGQLRDFADMIDVNRAALSTLETNRGAMLKRHWVSLK